MHLPVIRHPGLRRTIATFIALLAAYVPFALRWFPVWVSDSSPPVTAQRFATNLILTLGTMSLFHLIWLFPCCVYLDLVMTRKQLGGTRWAVRVGAVGALVAMASLFPWLPATAGRLSEADWLRRVPAAIEACVFVITWQLILGLLTPASPPAEKAASPRRLPREQVVSGLLLTGVLLWTVFVGFIAAAFLDFGGDGEHRLETSVTSPNGDVRADIVTFVDPGGALRSGPYCQVYLLPSSRPWSPRNRGLLIWQGKRMRVAGVDWESDRSIRVRVNDHGRFSSARDRARDYARQGYTARMEVVPES